MDDVARELGISKKTLYLFFKDKNDLVYKTMECQIAIDREDCEISFLVACIRDPRGLNRHHVQYVTEDHFFRW